MLSNEWAYEWMWDESGNEHFYVFTINHTNYWDRICSSDSLNNLGDVNERIDRYHSDHLLFLAASYR